MTRYGMLLLAVATFWMSGSALEAAGDTTSPATAKLSKTNPADREFPGGRGADELILYSPAFGSRTGTNDYGIEAVIRDGVVVRCEGNNSEIPDNGFVLSGHGKMAQWIIDHLKPGTEVTVDGGNVKARQTARSRRVQVGLLLKAAEKRLGETGDRADLKAARTAMDKAAVLLAQLDNPTGAGTNEKAIARLLDEAEGAARQARARAEATTDTEGRGLWFRLRAKDERSTRDLVARAEAMGVNMLFPETLYWSGTLCPPVRDGGPRQHPEFAGWDPLSVLIDEAHKRGLEVHAWCEIFFAGPEEPALAVEHPDWLAMDRQGGTRAVKEQGFRFLCPSSREAREYVVANLEAIARKYAVDGIHYDYIRYPVSEPFDIGFCYCPRCRAGFARESGFDPMHITPGDNPAEWTAWTAWRMERISSFVEEATARLREARPGLRISAAIFPSVKEEARGQKMQDWPLWAERGWLDFICPMAYFIETAAVGEKTQEAIDHAHGIPVYAGLAPFMGLTDMQLLDQVAATRDRGAAGQVLFAEEILTQPQREALAQGPWRQRARIPHR